MLRTEEIAQVCYAANKAYNDALGEETLPWEEVGESVYFGVIAHLENPASPRYSHERWLEFKRGEGWTYGPEKDPTRKQHPCMVPYDDLPKDQKRKDALFTAIIKALT